MAQIGDKLSEVDTKFAVSTEDLINGLERASASARVAGVSFDELLAVVTTVQERTQRGGAVIGNAFKTIFARLSRSDTLVALEELGISVLDTSGNVRGAIPLFKDLAVELNKVGLRSLEAGDIIQKVAGVRQRDILISLVEDLNSSQSQFAKSLQVSANAAGALDSKNASLNQTLEALINNLVIGGQKLSSILGELGFTDKAKDILNFFGSVVNGITDLLQGDSLGAKFAQGIIRGIGGVITVPGLALIGGIFIKLFIDLAKFGASSLSSLLGINQAAQQQKTLQQSVLQTLFQNENVQREILALEGNKVAQEQLLLKIYNQQAAALARVQQAAAVVTPGLFGAGLRGGSSGVVKGKAAGGYIASEARDVSRGVGGAPSSAKVVSIPNFAFGGGERGTMVANTSEYVVPNYAGGGDAIFNKDMVKTMGLPSGAKKLNAAGGFIPNFAAAAPRSLERLRGIAKGKGPQALAAEKELANRQSQKSSQKLIYDPRFAMIVPQILGAKQQVQGTRGGKKVAFDLVGYEPGVGSRVKNDEQLDDSTRKFAIAAANQQAQAMGGPPTPDKKLKLANSGAISALSGAIFETAVSALLDSKDFDSRSEIAAFDFVGASANQSLKKLFPQLGNATQIEAKIRPSADTRKSMFDKILKATGNAAGGYIPNFAGGALDQAVAREQSAGLPINQIRINQSGKLRNSQNPMGLAVTNTRDEPTGAIPNFAAGGRSTPATTGGSSDGGFGGGLIAASTGLYFLSSAFSNAESTFGKLISQVALAASALTTLSLLQGPVANIGTKLSGFGTKIATFNPQNPGKRAGLKGGLGRGIAGLGGALPGIGTAIAIGAVVAPLVLELTKTKTGFEKLNEELKNVDLKGLAEGSKEAQAAFLQNLIAEKERRSTVEKTKKETGIKKETLDEIFAAAAKRVGKETGFKDQQVLATSIAALDEERVKYLIAKATDTNPVNTVISGGAAGGLQGSYTSEKTTLRANDLLDSLIGAIKDNIAAAETAASTAANIALVGKFGTGAKTGGFAKSEFEKNITEGQFAAGGFDRSTEIPGKGVMPDGSFDIGGTERTSGGLSNIMSNNFKLAKAVTTESKIALENQIALDKNSIEASKARFEITKDYVKSIDEANAFKEEEFDLILKAVKEGKNLLEIQKVLLGIKGELNVAEQESFQLALAKLEIKNKELAQQEQEIINQNDINALSGPQGFKEGIRSGLGDLENDIAFFRDELGKNIPAQFSSNLGSALKEAVSEAKTLDEALSDAGRNFLGFIRDAFLQQAANQLTSGLFGSSEGKGGLFGGGSKGGGGGIIGGIKSLFGGKSGADSPDGTSTNPMYTLDASSTKNPADALTGEGKGEGIFSKLKTTLSESFSGLKTIFGDLFGSLTDKLGPMFKNLLGGLGGLFSGGGGGGGGGLFGTILGAFGFAGGGAVGFANGGSVGPTDTIPAMLTPGEFVMKKSAVDKYGSGFLSSLNESAMPMRGFQNGGIAGPISAEAGTGSSSASQVTNSSDFTFNIQDGKAEQSGGKNNTDQQRDFAQKVKAAVTTVVQEESRTGGTLSYLYKK